MSIAIKQPRDYQQTLIAQTLHAWQTHRTVLVVAPARSGKTVIFSNVIRDVGPVLFGTEQAVSLVVAHRTELLSQASATLAEYGIPHRVIGSDALVRACIQEHVALLGRSYVVPTAKVAIGSVDTLRRRDKDDPFLRAVQVAIFDEGHHVLRKNKWGKVVENLPPAAKILLATATPERADGAGLSLQSDGYAEVMFVGPSPRELIDRKFICEYRIAAPKSDLNLSGVHVGADGEFKHDEVAAAVHQSKKLTGNIVREYLKRCRGLLGMTFCVDIEHAKEVTQAFRDAGVPTELVTGDTPAELRTAVMQRYRRREIHMLVNVELFGEGVSVPDMEVVILARPTNSYGLFIQQFFRPHTLREGKRYGWVIDHVGNVERFTKMRGLPCMPQNWNMHRREKRAKGDTSDVIPTRTCLEMVPVESFGIVDQEQRLAYIARRRAALPPGTLPDELVAAGWSSCDATYERTKKCCPDCGAKPTVGSRGAPEHVDGDLFDVDPAALERIYRSIRVIDGAPQVPRDASPGAQYNIAKNWIERQKAQYALRSAISLWAGWQKYQGRDESETYKRFFFRYSIDVATACTLGRPEADALRERIEADLAARNVVDATVNNA